MSSNHFILLTVLCIALIPSTHAMALAEPLVPACETLDYRDAGPKAFMLQYLPFYDTFEVWVCKMDVALHWIGRRIECEVINFQEGNVIKIKTTKRSNNTEVLAEQCDEFKQYEESELEILLLLLLYTLLSYLFLAATMSRASITNLVDAHSLSSDNVDDLSTCSSDCSFSTGSVSNHDLSDVDSSSSLSGFSFKRVSVNGFDFSEVDTVSDDSGCRDEDTISSRTKGTNLADAHSLSSDNVDNLSTSSSDSSFSTGSVSNHDLSDVDSRLPSRLLPATMSQTSVMNLGDAHSLSSHNVDNLSTSSSDSSFSTGSVSNHDLPDVDSISNSSGFSFKTVSVHSFDFSEVDIVSDDSGCKDSSIEEEFSDEQEILS